MGVPTSPDISDTVRPLSTSAPHTKGPRVLRVGDGRVTTPSQRCRTLVPLGCTSFPEGRYVGKDTLSSGKGSRVVRARSTVGVGTRRCLPHRYRGVRGRSTTQTGIQGDGRGWTTGHGSSRPSSGSGSTCHSCTGTCIRATPGGPRFGGSALGDEGWGPSVLGPLHPPPRPAIRSDDFPNPVGLWARDGLRVRFEVHPPLERGTRGTGTD